jgi:SET domain-containing protein
VRPADPLPATSVTTSAIAGRGLRAETDIVARRAVLRFDAPPGAVEVLGPVNHSCDPNLAWSDGRTLAALRDITAGQELTLDYATGLDDPDFLLYCHCGTYRCRQVIEGTDWQIPQLQQRYAGRWAPAVQHRIDRAGR